MSKPTKPGPYSDLVDEISANGGNVHYPMTPPAKQPNREAARAGVKAAVADHSAMNDAAGLQALDAMDQADAERERERIERLHRDHPYLAGGDA